MWQQANVQIQVLNFCKLFHEYYTWHNTNKVLETCHWNNKKVIFLFTYKALCSTWQLPISTSKRYYFQVENICCESSFNLTKTIAVNPITVQLYVCLSQVHSSQWMPKKLDMLSYRPYSASSTWLWPQLHCVPQTCMKIFERARLILHGLQFPLITGKSAFLSFFKEYKVYIFLFSVCSLVWLHIC